MSMNRRQFLRLGARGTGLLVLAGVSGVLLGRARDSEGSWVIDADKCTACGKCATHCVHAKSVVVARNNYETCGFCTYCYGYEVKDNSKAEAAMAESMGAAPVAVAQDAGEKPKDLVCPHNALKRRRVGESHYEYAVDEDLCTGCGKCVARCRKKGNGSLFLVVRRDSCAGCNRCSIAQDCRHGAFVRENRGAGILGALGLV